MYELVVFDWDGTIIDSAQKIANCLQASARDVGLPVPDTLAAKNIIGLGLEEAVQILFGSVSELQYKALIDAYRHHFVVADDTEQRLFVGVESGLLKLQEAGVLLAVATGKSRAGLDRVFDEMNLRHHFVTSRCADEARSKPHPQMLYDILDVTAIAPERAVMIGDTTYDMQMASAANVTGLGVSYGVHDTTDLYDCDALHVVNSFQDVIDWLLAGRVRPAFS